MRILANMTLKTETKGMLIGLVGIIMFSLTLPMTRIAVQEINPIWLALARCEIAAVLAAVILLLRKESFPKRHLWPKIFWTSIGVIFGFPIFSSIAMRYTDASHGAIITGLLPITTALIATQLAKEKPSAGFWITAVAGSAVVLGYALWQSKGAVEIGDAMMLIAVIAGAVGYALGGQLATSIGGWQAISWALVCSAPFVTLALGALAYFQGGWAQSIAPVVSNISAKSWLGLAYVTIFSQLVGFFFWYGGMAMGGVARVSQVQLMQLFFTVGFASVLNKEEVSASTWIVVIVVVLIIFLNKRTSVKPSVKK